MRPVVVASNPTPRLMCVEAAGLLFDGWKFQELTCWDPSLWVLGS